MMSCMSHSCVSCDWSDDDNRRLSKCPVCGSGVTNQCDEPPRDKEPDAFDDEDDDDEDDFDCEDDDFFDVE